MPLNREKLLELAIARYFEACNHHDLEQVLGTFADDCLMWFPATTFRYSGIEALTLHFREFLGTFRTINFHNYSNIVDVDSQSLVSYFDVHLTPHDGESIEMKNCNIFHSNEQGLFNEIIIYNTQPLSDGFNAGSE
ncbi:MAG: nuclear transport factor 2 family protein [Woeseiaceae bacterium]